MNKIFLVKLDNGDPYDFKTHIFGAFQTKRNAKKYISENPVTVELFEKVFGEKYPSHMTDWYIKEYISIYIETVSILD